MGSRAANSGTVKTWALLLAALVCWCAGYAIAQPPQDNATPPDGAAPQAGTEREFSGIPFVWCPPGEYTMGASRTPHELAETFRGAREEWYSDATPPHPEKIPRGFWMSSTEITRAQWERIMGTAPWEGNVEDDTGSGAPATFVSWLDAGQFADALGNLTGATCRLPSEAEWEYACRAGTQSLYSFGNDGGAYDEFMWHWGNTVRVKEPYPHEVASKKPNPWGLYDMHGNVWEWCLDPYASYDAKGGAARRESGLREVRVLRGASFTDWASLHLSSYRSAAVAQSARPEIGFRVIIEP